MTWLDTLREGRSVVLRLAVDTGLDDLPTRSGKLGSHQARGFSLVEFELTHWTMADDHVLLWDYQEPFLQLNFNRALRQRHDHGTLASSTNAIWRLRFRGFRSSATINPAKSSRAASRRERRPGRRA